MKFSPIKNSLLSLSIKDLLILLLGLSAVTLQHFFLPFHVWDAGVARPWYMLHGMLPYKDFVWIRMPFDLFLLEGWYKVFGANGFSYQIFIYALLVLLSILVFFVGKSVLRKFYFLPFLFFNIFLFPLFQNTEEGEILIGIFNLLLFWILYLYFKNKNIKYLFAAGIISGISFITKQNSVLVIGATIFTVLLDFYLMRIKMRELIRSIGIYLLGAAIPVLGIISYFAFKQGLEDFLHYTVFFILGTYSQAHVNQGDGLLIAIAYGCLLIPFTFYLRKIGWGIQAGIFLLLQIIFLFPSLFPSFLSYRAFTAFPLISIVAGILLAMFVEKRKGSAKIVIPVAFIAFLFFISTFINSYISSIKYGEIKPGQYITSYGERELKIANLIRKNSTDNEKIISYSNEMIYVLSDRLPANKYVDPFPYLLVPYDKTTKVFMDNLPRLVVFDKTLPNDHPGLSDWPFIKILEKEYDIVGKFEENITVYKYRND